MTGPRQPQTCSHPIYARMLTRVHQAVRYSFLAIFHVSISIGTLESDSLSLSASNRLGLFIYCLIALYKIKKFFTGKNPGEMVVIFVVDSDCH